MSYLINNQQKMNDVIFADRNKSYGAYVLRSTYGNTIVKSLTTVIFGAASIMSIAFYYSNKNDQEPDKASGQIIPHDSIYVIPFKKDPDDQPKSDDTHPDEAAATKKLDNTLTDNVNVIDSTKIETSKSNSVEAVTSLTNALVVQDPNPGGVINGTISTGHKGDSTGSETKAPYEVDSQPEFEGGLSALYRFVASQLHYPEIASIEGKGGTVYVKFVVDENGKVGKLSLLNNLGYGLDDEALRVVALIPKFKKPATAAGHNVKVYYQLPIKFVAH